MAVQVVDPLEMIEVEQEQDTACLRLERLFEAAHELAPVGKAGRGVRVRITLGKPFGFLISVERFAKILRTG